jgi:hypothetical protein
MNLPRSDEAEAFILRLEHEVEMIRRFRADAPQIYKAAKKAAWHGRVIGFFNLALAVFAVCQWDAPAPTGFLFGLMFCANLQIFFVGVLQNELRLATVRHSMANSTADLARVEILLTRAKAGDVDFKRGGAS